MKTTAILITSVAMTAASVLAADAQNDRIATVINTPGIVAFWDFVKREPAGAHRFTAHVPAGATNDYALDAANYIADYWGEGRAASYADFPLLGRGPFGQAIRICKEEDVTFRPFLFVPRARLHDSPLDIKGAGKSVTVVVWAIRESGNHALACLRMSICRSHALRCVGSMAKPELRANSPSTPTASVRRYSSRFDA